MLASLYNVWMPRPSLDTSIAVVFPFRRRCDGPWWCSNHVTCPSFLDPLFTTSRGDPSRISNATIPFDRSVGFKHFPSDPNLILSIRKDGQYVSQSGNSDAKMRTTTAPWRATSARGAKARTGRMVDSVLVRCTSAPRRESRRSWQNKPRRVAGKALENVAIAEGPMLAAAIAVPVVGLLALRISVYFRLQYITAAMIGNNVPKGESRVAELGIGTGKNLYYYPEGTILVYGVDEKAKQGLLEKTAIAAGVPVKVINAAPPNTGLPSASVDAVVSTGALGISNDRRGCVKESLRILKPGKPLIFVESLTGAAADIPEVVRNEGGFKAVQIDEEWEKSLWAPHAVGVALKEDVGAGNASVEKERLAKLERTVGKGGRKKRK